MNRADKVFAALAFFAPLVLYAGTLCPTVPVGDGGELICSAHGLGIAHPTGYPLFCLLGRLFSLALPVGNFAVRINAMSAVFASLAVVIIYFLSKEVFRHFLEVGGVLLRSAALFAALAFACSETMWSQAVQTEVYALQIFLISGFLLVLVLWRRTRNRRLACLLGLIWGLSLANHTSAVFLLIPLVYLIISRRHRLDLAGDLLGLALFFLLGISLYVYLPLRSALNPIHDWGNPENLRLFWEHVTARTYRQHFLFAFPSDILNNLRHYMSLLADQFGLLLLGVSLIGAVIQGIRRPRFFLCLLLVVLGNVLLAASYDIQDIEAYYLPSYLIFALWLGLAVATILAKTVQRHPGLAFRWGVVVSVALLAVPLLSNYSRASQRGRTLARDHARNILSTAEPGAVLFVAADNESFPTLYLHYVEGVRPDISLFDMGSSVEAMRRFAAHDERLADVDAGQLRRLIVERTTRPVNFTKEHLSAGTDVLQLMDLDLVPSGMIYRLRRLPHQVLEDRFPWPEYSGQMLEDIDQIHDYRALMMAANFYLCWGEDLLARGDTTLAKDKFAMARSKIAAVTIAKVHNEMGIFFRRIGWAEGAMGELDKALQCSQRTTADRASIHVNRGNLYVDLGRYDLARQEMERSLRIWPEHRQARFNLARLRASGYLRTGDFGQAAAEYEKMVAIDDEDAAIFNNLGFLYAHRLNNLRRARECFRRYLELRPKGVAAERVEAELRKLEGKN